MKLHSSTTVTFAAGSHPYNVAIDGTGNVRVANEGFGTPGTAAGDSKVMELSTGSGVIGTYVAGSNPLSRSLPYGMAIDGNGNVWIANAGNGTAGTAAGDSNITEFMNTGATGIPIPLVLQPKWAPPSLQGPVGSMTGAGLLENPANKKKTLKTVREFRSYIEANRALIPNYGDHYRHDETISTVFVESTVNYVVSKRFVKKQQLRRTRRGAHFLLQTRVQVLNDDLRKTFGRWFPGMKTEERPKLKAVV